MARKYSSTLRNSLTLKWPVCMNCNVREAKKGLFCSDLCGREFANAHLKHSGYIWCATDAEWIFTNWRNKHEGHMLVDLSTMPDDDTVAFMRRLVNPDRPGVKQKSTPISPDIVQDYDERDTILPGDY